MSEEKQESTMQWSDFCKLTEFAADWVWELDRDFRFTQMEGNNIFLAHESAEKSLIGKRPWEIGLEIFGAQSWDEHQVQLSSATPFRNLKVQRRFPDGTVLYAHISGAPFFDDNGNLLGYRGTGIDITKEELAAQEHHWFSAVVDTSPNSIIVTDIEKQRFLYVNKTAYESKGMSKEEHLAIEPTKFTGSTPSELAKFYQTVIGAGEAGITSKPRIFHDKTGKKRSYWELHRRAIHVDGRWLLSTISRDVTARVLAQEAEKLVSQMYEARCAIDDFIESKPQRSDLIAQVCQKMASRGQFKHTALMLKSADGRTLELACASGSSAERFKDFRLDIDNMPTATHNNVETKAVAERFDGLVETALWSKQPCISTSFNQAPNTSSLAEIIKDEGIKSAAVFPLLDMGEVQGVLILCSEYRRAFSSKCVRIASGITSKLETALRELDREQELQLTEQKLQYIATHDPLTGLHNRQLFDDLVRTELLSCERKKSQLALLHVDLDKFAEFNRHHGHVAGDDILRAVADRLKNSIGHNDSVCRIGADQFLVLLRNIQQTEDAAEKARIIQQRINEPITAQDKPHSISVCIGISAYPSHAVTERELLRLASSATMKAKQNKPNTIALATPNK
ncbi:MAG: diguanylate cyclase [Pseudohongiellaceae bacterium]|nr:diguanylate cyclase [Pseudohongiellaceae bacterium]